MTTPLNSLPEKWRAPDPYDSNHYWEARGDQCADELEAALTAHNQRWLDLADELKPEEANNEEYLEGINRGKEIARNRIRQILKEQKGE